MIDKNSGELSNDSKEFKPSFNRETLRVETVSRKNWTLQPRPIKIHHERIFNDGGSGDWAVEHWINWTYRERKQTFNWILSSFVSAY